MVLLMLPDPRQIQSSSFSYGTQYEKKIIIEMLNRATTTRKRVGRKERRKGVRRKKSSLEKGHVSAGEESAREPTSLTHFLGTHPQGCLLPATVRFVCALGLH